MSAATSAPGRRNVAVRPKKPPPSPFLVWGSLGLTVTTLVLGSDWAYGIGFSLGDIYDNLGRYNPVVDGIRNLDGGTLASPRVISGFVETFQMAAIATVLGGIVALPVAVLSSVTGAPNTFVYVVVKNISGFIRAIPDLIYAVFFVAAVGRGALPGVLALFLLSIAVIAKLTSDIVDGIDQGPIESARASGASHTQMLATAVVPQILPGYASFALYTFEINLRGSAVLGFVGAGGIGEVFNNYYQRGWYDRLVAVVIGFFAVVFVVDRISIAVRKRLL